MYYVGQGNSGGCGIGFATSVDGYHWIKVGSAAVISSAGCLSVDQDGDSLIMLYMGGSGFNRASSQYGQNWVQCPGNPVFQPDTSDSAWDEIIASPSLVVLNGQYHLWYTGADTLGNTRGKIQIGYATSVNRGRSWTRFAGNPVLRPDQPWEGKCLYTNNAVMSASLYQMWYGSAGFGYAYNYVDSINEFKENGMQSCGMKVFPNPARKEILLQVFSSLNVRASVRIFDVSGRIGCRINPILRGGKHTVIPITLDLPAGVYFLVVQIGRQRLMNPLVIAR